MILEYMNEWDVLCCDVMLDDKVIKWCELCLSKFYFVYMISIPTCCFVFSLLVRNVITHNLCAICVWILWWSQTLCSWEQMIRWITMKNLMLEDMGTQCSDRMWHWDIGSILVAWSLGRPCFESRWFIIYLDKLNHV